jgi:hypothetical protein
LYGGADAAVHRHADGPFDLRDPEGPFVLKPWKDPAARRALEAYRDHCYPELARELDAWIRTIRSGSAIRGGVGARNEPYAVARPKSVADAGEAEAVHGESED